MTQSLRSGQRAGQKGVEIDLPYGGLLIVHCPTLGLI